MGYDNLLMTEFLLEAVGVRHLVEWLDVVCCRSTIPFYSSYTPSLSAILTAGNFLHNTLLMVT